MIHRDLKPANIMVGAFGEVQVMNWGLAKALSTGGVADEKRAKLKQRDHSLVQTMRSTGSDIAGSFGSAGSETEMGSVMGTPAYMPPEQALGEIDQLERTEVEVQNFTQYGEEFPIPLAIGFLLLMTELGLAQTVLRRLP